MINPTTVYVCFSPHRSVRSKASKRRFSYSKASFDNAARGQTRAGLSTTNQKVRGEE